MFLFCLLMDDSGLTVSILLLRCGSTFTLQQAFHSKEIIFLICFVLLSLDVQILGGHTLNFHIHSSPNWYLNYLDLFPKTSVLE